KAKRRASIFPRGRDATSRPSAISPRSTCFRPPPTTSRRWRRKARGSASRAEGSRERLGHVLAEHGLPAPPLVTGLPGALALGKSAISLAVLGIEHGFETE